MEEGGNAGNPADRRAAMDLSYDYSDLGWVASHMDALPQALAAMRRAQDLRLAATQADPNDFRAAFAFASITGRIGGLLEKMGNAESSLAELEKALSLWTVLAQRPSVEWTTITELADANRDVAKAHATMAARRSSPPLWLKAAGLYEKARDF